MIREFMVGYPTTGIPPRDAVPKGGVTMLDYLKDLIRPLVRPPLHKPEVRMKYQVSGTRYGAWPLLDRDRNPIVLSFGVGEDISWDMSLVEQGLEVHAFDPTPRCRAWLAQQALPPRFHFHPWGLAARDGTVEMFPPANANHVSFSAQRTSSQAEPPVKAEVFSLSSIASKLDLAVIDTAKMDIEGFEYQVIKELYKQTHLPRELLVEFHHNMYGYDDTQTIEAVEQLRNLGYVIYYVSPSGHEYGLVRKS